MAKKRVNRYPKAFPQMALERLRLLHRVPHQRRALRKNLPPPPDASPSSTPGGAGVRVDTAMYAEGIVPPYYDSLIAKLITRGKDRPEAIARMARALEMFAVEGIYTTIPCTAEFWPTPISRPGTSTQNSWNGFWRLRSRLIDSCFFGFAVLLFCL